MYGSARLRAYYGAGDYSSGLALRQAYAGGTYAAGGFFSKALGFAKKAVGTVAKVASNPLVSTGLSFLPFGGLVGKAAGIASKLAPLVKRGAGIAAAAGIGGIASGLATRAAFGGPSPSQASSGRLPSFGSGPAAKAKRSRSSSRSRSRSGRTTRRRSRSRPRGDLRESDGRWTSAGRVSMAYPHSGHYHGPKRGRRRRGGGGKVSFTTKDGRRVSFNARGDA